MTYQEFLASKRFIVPIVGKSISADAINPVLFPFQKDLVRWAVRKGRCAIFAHTGLGKTFMLAEWARLIGVPTLSVAPLSVARQTVKIAREHLGIDIHYVRHQDEVADDGIYITNYEMVEHFDPSKFGAVNLDESSILKNLDGHYRHMLTDMFADTPYRLCTTATPAPNDVSEIGRHAEFLGIMTNSEMLAAFFVNDLKMKDGTYRLKRHAQKAFYRWLASWGLAVQKPSDLGYPNDGFELPPLHTELVSVNSDFVPEGMLPGFNVGSLSAIEAKKVRHQTVNDRAAWIADKVNADSDQWVIWCGLNDEADTIEKLIPGSVQVYGSQSPEEKAQAIEDWQDGKYRVLVTKIKIAGFGMNLQNAHKMIFAGIDYSWEGYFQAVRRCWRFGQTSPVDVYVVTSEQEADIYQTILRKEKEALKMVDELVKNAAEYAREEIEDMKPQDFVYATDEHTGDGWRLLLGDSCERIAEIPENSVDLTVFSPPFINLYAYTPTERDMGNSRNPDQFFEHFDIIIKETLRITKPGRNCCVHVQQLAATKVNDGFIGIKDFRGDVIRAFQADGWVFHGEITVDKNPQVQAIRTKTKGLMFVQLHKDSAASRPGFADYLLIFQKPGENEVPVIPDVTNEEWIQWAHPVWYDINETDVLNAKLARGDEDERHLCPLQLPFIARCIRLWSNRGETVFDPFAGIGSTLYEAVRFGRKGLGIELKPEYFAQATKNLTNAERLTGGDLFAWADQQASVEAAD
jgi:DNA modification methylase